MQNNNGKLVVISGPSGVGKSTIAKELPARTGATLSVSVTTRAPRPGEVDGRDYYFVDRPKFDAMVAGGEFLEHAEVFGRCYGTPAAPVKEAIANGRTMILEIDVQGGLQVHKAMPDATFVLVVPPSDEDLKRRLAGRGSEGPEELAKRLGKAQAELALARNSGAYKIEVVNDDLQRAIAEVASIVSR